MKTPKFNFIPERQLGEVTTGNGHWSVTIIASKASPAIYFPKDMARILEMDGKYIKVFADTEKKAIGWRLIQDETTLPELNNARKITANKVSGAVILGIGRILKTLNYDLKEKIKGLLVQTYSSPLIKDDISYVVLPDVEVSRKQL